MERKTQTQEGGAGLQACGKAVQETGFSRCGTTARSVDGTATIKEVAESVLRFAFALALVTSSRAQTHSEDHAVAGGIPLHLTAKVEILREAARPIYKPAKCDAQGNIYFRAYQADDRRIPVVRADATGATTKFSLDGDTVLAKGTSYDFSILPDGSLHQPIQVGEDVYIVAFDKDGKVLRKIKLQKKFWIARLTAFNDHGFLVIGTEQQASGPRQQPPQPVIALFDDRGALVRDVNLNVNPGSGHADILAVLSSDAQVTAGGVVYLMVRTNPVLVYRLEPSGTVAPPLKVIPPEPRMTPLSMSIAHGRVAILFRESFQGMQHGEGGTIVVVDAATGAETGRYASGGLGTTLACYTPDDFVFLGSANQKLVIQHASAK